ncbi:ATP-dependent DNA helicase Q4-like [Antedon mediterranea]|uniref:ATP-dependent DNA helicase Q4-like n=1 Tax=Antedon mediterranea TaxID=105859 RepID=UPI003AF83719
MGVEERKSVLKKALKEWENAFAVLHDRRPNKDDIEKASDKIKGYYKEYRQLGKPNSEIVAKEKILYDGKDKKSSHNTGNVWGVHLNIKEKIDKEATKKVSPEEKPSYGLKIREFNKALPTSARKRTNKLKVVNVSAVQKELIEEDDSTFDLPSCKLVSKSDKLKNTSVASASPNILANKKPRLALDNAWLKRCQTKLIKEKTVYDVPMETNNGNELNNFEEPTPHVTTPLRTFENNIVDSLSQVNKNQQITDSNAVTETTSMNVHKNNESSKINHQIESNQITQKRDREELTPQIHLKNQTKKRKVDSVETTQTAECEKEQVVSKETVSSILEEQPALPRKIENRIKEAEEDQESSEEEKPVKKKKKLVVPSAPSRSTASLNENFVRINLRKKVYTRAPNKMTGPLYKRQQWKVKMGKASGKSYGRGGGGGGGGWHKPGVCFKCGQEGHWAKFCKGRLPPKPDKEEEEDIKPEDLSKSPFPTLEEAALAATGIKHPKGDVIFDFLNAPAPPPDDEAPVIRNPIEPLFRLNENGRPIETPNKVYKALKEMGYDSFRGGQEKAIMRILSGLSTLVVLSTGAGKSLCYQLPAYMYAQRSHCLTLVISPLVSLMEDQVIGLPGCLQGARLHSNMAKSQRERVVKEIIEGKVQVLLISPEAVVGGGGGGGCLPPLHQLPPIAFACIDEAHCVSEWSHNFRPSYLMVCKVIRERFGVQCLLGLTATATMSTAMSVVSHLGIDEDAVVRGRSVPNNLKLSVSKDENRDKALVELLQGDRFKNLDSIIVYCIRRDQTEKVASVLRTCLPDGKRKKDPEPEEDPEKVEKAPDDILENVEKEEAFEGGKKQRKGKTKKEVNEEVMAPEEIQENVEEEEIYKQEKEVTKGGKRKQKKQKEKKKRTKASAEDPEEVEIQKEEEVGKDEKKKRKGKKKAEKKVKKPKKPTYKTTIKPYERPDINSVESYHAGMTASERRKVQNAFMSGSIRIVVATVAFGMGLDKSDVRAIIHYNMPKSFESYVQEIGRAGRDGKPAHCHLFLDSQGRDLSELRRHTYANTLDRFTLKKLCRKVFSPCRCKEKARARQAAKELKNFQEEDDEDYMMIPDEVLSQKASEIIPQTPDDAGKITTTKVNDLSTIVPESAKASVNNSKTSDGLKEQIPEDIQVPTEPSSQTKSSYKIPRLCPGHERAISIEQNVESLDIKEEGIATLLCNLELHPQQWVNNLPPALATCTINCYGGPKQLQTMAHKCPALAAAIALHQEKTGKSLRNKSGLEFPVVDVASEMNWQAGMVKKQLKSLQWNGQMKSGVMVELSDLGFHFRSPGDLTDEELDGVVDFLYSKVKGQEKRELYQLKSVFKALNSVSCDHFWMCSADVDEETSDELKQILREYFDTSSLVQWMEDDNELELDNSLIASAASVRGSVRGFISLHHDRDFSGRAIARIFHGIASPCYPAQVWGRDRRYWRCHLNFDFNLLIKIATEVVLKMR